jgi:hypothetical protein
VTELSVEARKLLDGLTKGQRRTLQKGNPFKADRNNAICRLKARGVKAELLAEVTGLSHSTIFRILQTNSASAPDSMNGALERLREVFDALYKAFVSILTNANTERKGGDES